MNLGEPMAGLDAAMQVELQALLDRLAGHGITIVLSTHDVDFAYRWADDLHLLAGGRCLGSFAADQLPEHAALLAAAGQPLPAVIRLHQQLAARGQMASDVRPRSLDILMEISGSVSKSLKNNAHSGHAGAVAHRRADRPAPPRKK